MVKETKTAKAVVKKPSEETQNVRAGCKGGAKNFRPAADPPPGGAGRPKFNQLEIVTTFTYKPSLVVIDTRNFELSWPTSVTHPHTHTDRTD